MRTPFLFFFWFFGDKFFKYDYFFIVLKTEAERDDYIKNSKNKRFNRNINLLMNLFIKYSFYKPEIFEALEGIKPFKGEKIEEKITKWQKSFYKNIYKEHKSGNDCTQFNQLTESKNNSFQFLFKLEDESFLMQKLTTLMAEKEEMNQKDTNDLDSDTRRILSKAFRIRQEEDNS